MIIANVCDFDKFYHQSYINILLLICNFRQPVYKNLQTYIIFALIAKQKLVFANSHSSLHRRINLELFSYFSY